MPIFEEYVNRFNAEVHVLYWDKNKLKPYEPKVITNVTYYKRSEYSNSNLLNLANKVNPDIIYVSGWMDKGYLYVTKRMKKTGIPVVTGFDDIWTGSLRQRIGTLIFPVYFKKYFSHAWVAGMFQFEFAKKLGFGNDNIIYDLLSADTNIFHSSGKIKIDSENRAKSFLYVGNFRKVKGLDLLVEAFDLYRTKYNGNWKLTCVGTGELDHILKNKDIKVIPFSNSEELITISKSNDVFILPSRHDQWGVVVHEFSSLGMPLLLSQNVGSKTAFLIDDFNGLIFENNSPDNLARTMSRFEEMDETKLYNMGLNSIILSRRINPKTSAANFMSILNSTT
tara:strand:+ start:13056 stop:14066 length:1011 start_codon:yes stop_codon:yes gene_type:complete